MTESNDGVTALHGRTMFNTAINCAKLHENASNKLAQFGETYLKYKHLESLGLRSDPYLILQTKTRMRILWELISHQEYGASTLAWELTRQLLRLGNKHHLKTGQKVWNNLLEHPQNAHVLDGHFSWDKAKESHDSITALIYEYTNQLFESGKHKVWVLAASLFEEATQQHYAVVNRLDAYSIKSINRADIDKVEKIIQEALSLRRTAAENCIQAANYARMTSENIGLNSKAYDVTLEATLSSWLAHNSLYFGYTNLSIRIDYKGLEDLHEAISHPANDTVNKAFTQVSRAFYLL